MLNWCCFSDGLVSVACYGMLYPLCWPVGWYLFYVFTVPFPKICSSFMISWIFISISKPKVPDFEAKMAKITENRHFGLTSDLCSTVKSKCHSLATCLLHH